MSFAAEPSTLALALPAALLLFAGNLAAVAEENLKRLAVFVSFAQVGYVLAAMAIAGRLADRAVAVHLAGLLLAAAAIAAAVTSIARDRPGADRLDDYRGLGRRSPLAAAVLAAAVLSLGAMPFTVGFIGRLLLLAAGARSGHWLLAAVVAVNSAMGLYWSGRAVIRIYSPSAAAADARLVRAVRPSGAALAAIGVLLVGLGVWPNPLLRMIDGLLGGGAL